MSAPCPDCGCSMNQHYDGHYPVPVPCYGKGGGCGCTAALTKEDAR